MPFPRWMTKQRGREVGWKCERCYKTFAQGWMLEAHHCNPTNNGGDDTFENMELLCLEDHYQAHFKLRKEGKDHPRSADLVKARLDRTGGRTRWWNKKNG